ncbi:vinorine synthase-like [Nicotiana tomentosiformis]|uniref:vinorine synthase-like n=1 Tax=Nicotiana tomentosiformis TaxID=4098 RepID=UPI00051AFF60|nr:vinorine synthase-like [Nicotiana tomentosiformis]
MERKIEIVCVEFIKPVSPTPSHLKCFEFSILDQHVLTIPVPLALFYPPPPPYGGEEARAANSSRLLVLKKSLSETLARFYPFAGRIKNNSIECNDDGVPFYEAFAHNYQLEDVLRKAADVNKKFLPSTVEEARSLLPDSALYPPLLVQVTFFECGSMAIGICASHKVADRATLCTLISAWSTIARGSPDYLVPEFVAAAKFLPPPISHVPPKPIMPEVIIKVLFDKQRVTKIFAFDASTITSLKGKAVSGSVQAPTHVEVVSALIWKCAMVVSGNEIRRLSQLVHNVNIRKRLVPPLPNHSVGNVVAISTSCKGEKDGSDLLTLVTCIRKALSEMSSEFADKQNQEEAILTIPYVNAEFAAARFGGEIEIIHMSSLCGYQFYDVDFGWGRPSWVNPIKDIGINVVILMDSRDSGGVDAWICLKDKDSMTVFEHELELQLLAFGSAK